MIKLMFGEMGQTLLLEGNNVAPKKLLSTGYVFKYPDLPVPVKNINITANIKNQDGISP